MVSTKNYIKITYNQLYKCYNLTQLNNSFIQKTAQTSYDIKEPKK